MATTYGQPPHFDLSKPLFTPLARIQYGSSIGNNRIKMAIRRYVYQYVNNSFVFLKTYKGTRQNPNRIKNVVDVNDINFRDTFNSVETLESSPEFITQDLLNSIFSFPNNGGIFFIEGRISKRHSPPSSNPDFEWEAPNWFDIYRYGKIVNNKIVVLKEREGDLITRDIN